MPKYVALVFHGEGWEGGSLCGPCVGETIGATTEGEALDRFQRQARRGGSCPISNLNPSIPLDDCTGVHLWVCKLDAIFDEPS